jgi:thiamine pyrophosphate-dependent acetolactate synthase large subunit-like protein
MQMVALSMADGFARLTNKPQCVIVHVDVGTQALGAGIHNASCGRAPVLIFAGLSPYTIEGEMRGSRTEFIHWIQDVPDQKQIVGQYCRYTGEIKSGKNVKVDFPLVEKSVWAIERSSVSSNRMQNEREV